MSIRSSWVGRTFRAMPFLVHAGLAAALGISATGCGALSALTNPKAAWALDESAPMSVVMRRAEVANATAKQVDRLMGETGVDTASTWTKDTSLKKADAEALLGEISKNDTYGAAKGVELRVVPAEAWVAKFSSICSSESEHPSLLAAQSPELARAYDEIAQITKKIAALETAKAEEETAADKDGAKPDEVAAHEKKVEELDQQIEALEDSVEPKKDEFIAKVREVAGKSDEATKKRLAVVLVNLRRAVEDAKNDNSVVLLRYPMAMTGLPSDLQSTAKRVLADVIEEQTGKRPNLSSFNPEVKLEGTDVKLSVAGLSATDIAGMSPDEVIETTAERMVGYVGRVVTLIAYADQTQKTLSFQGDVLDAWMEGLKVDPSSVPDAGDDISDLAVKTTAAAAAKTADAKPAAEALLTLGAFSPGGLRSSVCKVEKKGEAPVEVAETEKKDETKPTKAAKSSASKTASTTAVASTKVAPGKTQDAAAALLKAAATKTTAAPGPTVAASATTTKSDAPPAKMPSGSKVSDPSQCDIVVTNAEGIFCM